MNHKSESQSGWKKHYFFTKFDRHNLPRMLQTYNFGTDKVPLISRVEWKSHNFENHQDEGYKVAVGCCELNKKLQLLLSDLKVTLPKVTPLYMQSKHFRLTFQKWHMV